MEGNGAVFTLSQLDVSPLVDTVTANAPTIITAGVTVTLVIAAFNLIPRMIKRATRG